MTLEWAAVTFLPPIEPHLAVVCIWDDDEGQKYYVLCDDCGLHSPLMSSRDEAYAAREAHERESVTSRLASVPEV
jgi:hypothetical protein